MQRVALTGGIATGKSYVRASFEALGTPTLDSDGLVHELLGGDPAVISAVRLRFGEAVLDRAGAVDRAALGRVVFADRAARADLERLIHPIVYRRIGDWFTRLAAGGTTWALADVPLLYETGHAADFDRVIVAACAPSVQLARLRSRGLAEAEARARIASQWPTGEKERLADDIVWTDGTFADTDRQVRAIVEGLR
jgi:dephospho-CoA kinase